MIVYRSGFASMLAPWDCGKEFHTVGGNTCATVQLVGLRRLDALVDTCYWKSEYSAEHEAWIRENYHRIRRDEKWRLLDERTLAAIRGHRESRSVYEELLRLEDAQVGLQTANLPPGRSTP